VSLSSGPCLPDKVSFGAATCPMAPGSASPRGELRCCHVPHGSQRAVDYMNKERSSCPRHTARLACFQGLLRAFARHVAGSPRVGRQVAGPGQHSRPAVRSQWFATVPSGLTTLGRQRGQVGSYVATAARRQRRGPPVRHHYRRRHHYRPTDATAPRRTTDRV
jgi:hypothetical protein